MSMAERRRMLLATLGGGTPLSDLPEGSILKILEGGVLTDFYVAKHDYESGLNGAGRTLVVRKDCYDQRIWDSAGNALQLSSIFVWLNVNYKNLFSTEVQTAMGKTNFKYTISGSNTEVDTTQRSIFLLSVTELGNSVYYANTEGSSLSIANILRFAYLNGSKVVQWTRSPDITGTGKVCYFGTGGGVGSSYAHYSHGSRPAFTLPADAPCELKADGSYTLLL